MSDGGYIEDFADFTLVAAIKNSSKTSYTDKKLTPGKRYLYVVCAYREKDGKTSYLQESASIRLSANEKMAFTETSYTSAGNYTVKWNKMTSSECPLEKCLLNFHMYTSAPRSFNYYTK